MSAAESLDAFSARQTADMGRLCEALRAGIDTGLPEASARIWHAHPVWFLQDNPIVGYSVLKAGVRLLFWSGQSFAVPGLRPQGKFKAAEAFYRDASEIDEVALAAWLSEARQVQWDYRNIVKRRGRLVRLN